MNETINNLVSGLIQVLIEKEAYKKDDYFMDIWDGENPLHLALQNYLQLEKYCYFLKRKNLFYRTDTEIEDIISDGFIEAFFRSNGYPLKSYKGFTMKNGNVRTVRLSKFLKDSLESKVITISKAIHEKKKLEISESRISTAEGESFGFDEFLAVNGVESSEISLEAPIDLDECDELIMQLSKELFPQVSYIALLKDYEIQQDDFQKALKCELNHSVAPEYLQDRYKVIMEALGSVVLNNVGRLSGVFSAHRLAGIKAI